MEFITIVTETVRTATELGTEGFHIIVEASIEMLIVTKDAVVLKLTLHLVEKIGFDFLEELL